MALTPGPSTELMLDNGRFYRREIVTHDLGTQEAALANLLPETTVLIPSLMNLGGMLITGIVGKSNIALITELKSLPFRTEFEIDISTGNSMKMCVWPRPGSILVTEPWSLPRDFDGKMLFVVRFGTNGQGGFSYGNAYLWVYHQAELWYLAYPNVFNDGRVCMGGTFDGVAANAAFRTKPLNEQFMQTLLSFQESGMNDHLVTNTTHATFRRSLDEDKWLPPSVPMPRCLVKCSPSFMQGFRL